MTRANTSAIPDALPTLLVVAERLLDAYPALRVACARNLTPNDPQYPRQHSAFVKQRREITGLEKHPNDVIRAVLACHAIALTVRTLLARGNEAAAVAWLSPSDSLRVEYPNTPAVQSVDVSPNVCAHVITEHAIMTHNNAALTWHAFATYLRNTYDDAVILGLYCFRMEDDVLLARSPVAIDRALGSLSDPSFDDAVAYTTAATPTA